MAHRHRHELTDAQWTKIEQLLPGKESLTRVSEDVLRKCERDLRETRSSE